MMNQRFRTVVGCGGVLVLYALVTLPMLRTFPPIWPDEVDFYSAANSLARGEGMGTPVLAGFLPGIDRYTYWQPPGYFLLLSLVLRFAPPSHHFVALRLLSWFLGAVVLLLGADILRRLTKNWLWGLAALAVLATQVSFIQVANVGRMEMLTLACIWAAVDAYLAYRQKGRRHLLAVASFFAGLALLSHSAGIVAGLVMVVHEIASPAVSPLPDEDLGGRRKRWKDAGIFAGCAGAPLVAWAFYILRAPSFFSAQMSGQATRKSLSLGTVISSRGILHWLELPFGNSASPVGVQWAGYWPWHVGEAAIVELIVLGAGLAGLMALGRRRSEASILGALALAGYGVNLLMPEFWYAVYLVAPSCLLLGWALADSPRGLARALALGAVMTAGAWNYAQVKRLWWVSRDTLPAERLYFSSLSRMIPAHSTILLAAIPDPYFALREQNKSYRLLEFVPEEVPVDQTQANRILNRVDYVVGSDCCRPAYLEDYLLAHGKVVASFGSRDFVSPPVVLWKLHE